MKKKEIQHIADLLPDKRNARKHNPRNIGMIEKSLQEVGAARSIVIDENGNILAGNGTIEAAAQAGITRVQVVDTDGETIVAVRRTGLSKKEKKRLALYDNRTAELASWEPEVLSELRTEDQDILEDMFAIEELDEILNEKTEEEEETKVFIVNVQHNDVIEFKNIFESTILARFPTIKVQSERKTFF